MILNSRVMVPALDFIHDLKKAKFFLERLQRLVDSETDPRKKTRLIEETAELLSRLQKFIEQETSKEKEYGKEKLS